MTSPTTPFICLIAPAGPEPDPVQDCLRTLMALGVTSMVGTPDLPPSPAPSLVILFGDATVPDCFSCPAIRVPLDSGDPKENLLRLQNAASDPQGIPTLAIGKAGAINASLFASAMLSNIDPDIALRLHEFRESQTLAVLGEPLPRL